MTKKVTKRQIIDALYKSSGIEAQAARLLSSSLGIKFTRQAMHARIRKDPELQSVQIQARDAICDLAESVIVTELRNGNWRVAKTVLETLGRNRGYGRDTPVEASYEGKTPLERLLDTLEGATE